METTSATFDGTARREFAARLSFSEIVSALSFALDLTEGAVPGHALRSCLIGMRIGARLGLDPADMHHLYYALLLKDVGCSSNAARMCQIVGGDDRAMKASAKLEDWTKPTKPKLSTLKMLWGNVLPDAGAAGRALRIVKIGVTQHKINEELINLRCDRGAGIVRKLGLGEPVAESVRYLDEHWDGSGYPERLVGDRIPVLSRIMQVAQHLDVFASERGTRVAIQVLHERDGAWFDPEMVDVVSALHYGGSLWKDCLNEDPGETRRAVLDMEPGTQIPLDDYSLDRICEAFAEVVDAKSPFTFRHSVGVAKASIDIGRAMGLPQERIVFLRRAALLHDIGKLNVSNSILDKPNKLNDDEWQSVLGHPSITRRILERIGPFQEIALVAGEHHEKLDGSGYPGHLYARDLSLESRILGVADVYGALSENRPYRDGLSLEEIIAIMKREVPYRLDPECFEALLGHLGRIDEARKPSSVPAVVTSGSILRL